MRKTALLFPGQGAQYTGMGKDFYEQFKEAQDVFHKANETLGFDLSALCFHGKQEELNKTSICQPAILVTSIAILEVFKKILQFKWTRVVLPAGLVWENTQPM